MIYTLSIDWLSIYCLYDEVECKGDWKPTNEDGTLFGAYPWKYRLMDYGTRQFAQLYKVTKPNEEGGHDEFAEIQLHPYAANILKRNAVIVRFVNRSLYLPDFWTLAERFLADNHFRFQSITRIDICADFNDFATLSPTALIDGFAAKLFRHVGRGVGALYFNHGVSTEKWTGKKRYGVNFTGMSFGTHASDARVYLYNKSFELLTQGDKPWIRDIWTAAGLDVLNVWRLEISLKAKACKFKDKSTGEQVTIDTDNAQDVSELDKIYHTFVRRLFAFVHNHEDIKNISREPRIQLFDGRPAYDRGVIRNVTAGTRFDRMFIKALWQLGDLYRGASNVNSADLAQSFAVNIAESCDLAEWMSRKVNEWDKPIHK